MQFSRRRFIDRVEQKADPVEHQNFDPEVWLAGYSPRHQECRLHVAPFRVVCEPDTREARIARHFDKQRTLERGAIGPQRIFSGRRKEGREAMRQVLVLSPRDPTRSNRDVSDACRSLANEKPQCWLYLYNR